MSQSQAPLFKFGQGAIRWAFGITLSRIFQLWFSAEHRQHLLRIIFPVRSQMQHAAAFQAACQQLYEGRLNQASLMVPCLGPGIWKKDVNAIQGFRQQHVPNHLDGIVTHDAYVGDAGFRNAFEQAANAGGMHINGQKIFFWHVLRDGHGGFTHAKTDFQDQGCVPPKQGCAVLNAWRCGYEGYAPTRPKLFHRALLGRRYSSLSQDKTANEPWFGIQRINPLVGELGEAW